MTVVGFDTGMAGFNCSRLRIDGADIDANVGVFLGNADNQTPK